jgi:hypothetical protein
MLFLYSFRMQQQARRKLLASKSSHVADFLQRASVQATDVRLRDELLDLYKVVSGRKFELWNELE